MKKLSRTFAALTLAAGMSLPAVAAAEPAQAIGGGVVQNVSYETGWYLTFTLQNGTVITSLRPGDSSRTYGSDARSFKIGYGTCARLSINGGPVFTRQAGTYSIADHQTFNVARYLTSSTRC
jgi:hypothetical protein